MIRCLFICVAVALVSVKGIQASAKKPEFRSIRMSDIAADFSDKTKFETVYPVKLNTKKFKRAAEDGHEETASWLVKTPKKDLFLDLKKNTALFSPSFMVRSFDGNKEVLNQGMPEHCYYHGSVRGSPGSTVALSTCDGALKGVIQDGTDSYHIEPSLDHKNPGAHKLHQNIRENDEGKLSRRNYANVDDVYKGFFTTNETRYVEAVFVVDNEVHEILGNNKTATTINVCHLVNEIDAIYERINIRIVLKAVDIWMEKDHFNRSSSLYADIVNFYKYNKEVLKEKFGPYDHVHLLRSDGWNYNIAGAAFIRGICTPEHALGLAAWKHAKVHDPHLLVGILYGFAFGLELERNGSSRCKCLTPEQGCLMQYGKAAEDISNDVIPGFSSCNMKQLQLLNDDKCLHNVPTEAENARCGNGIREGSEECDCGSPENCTKTDHCCEPEKCVLKQGNQCSDLHHSCCKNCQIVSPGVTCREARGDCDVPEKCTGARDCPADDYVVDGTDCKHKPLNELLLADSAKKMKTLTPFTARYVRFSPQYWAGSPVCLRTELYGCDDSDCKSFPLLKDISDSNWTASSSAPDRDPHFGKIDNSDTFWCPDEHKVNWWDQFLQVDLGKEKSIKGIKFEGVDVKTGIYLYYSRDKLVWTGYSTKMEAVKSYCYLGKCTETRDMQCQEIWGSPGRNGAKQCYAKMNLGKGKYGTCVPGQNIPCQKKHVMCGQLQCKTNPRPSKPVISKRDYLSFGFIKKCSVIQLKPWSAQLGELMVLDGTTCGRNKKICMNQQCKKIAALDVQPCPKGTNGKECNGADYGICTNRGKCHCIKPGYDPATACMYEIEKQDGNWSKWTEWSACSEGCNSGTRMRQRFCIDPIPRNGGADCKGYNKDSENCAGEA